jgi:hypothetical protein
MERTEEESKELQRIEKKVGSLTATSFTTEIPRNLTTTTA